MVLWKWDNSTSHFDLFYIHFFFQRGMPSGNSNENKVFVGGLSSHTSEDDLRQFFSDTCGKVH